MELFVSQDCYRPEVGQAHPFVARLRERGHRVLSSSEELSRRGLARPGPLDAALLSADGLLGASCGVRLWTAMVEEHPMGHPQVLAALQPGALVIARCRSHVAYLRRVQPSLWARFIPHGATLPAHDAPDGRDRRFSVVMHSTPDLAQPELFDQWLKPFEERGSELADMFWLALARLTNGPELTVDAEVDAGLRRIGAAGLDGQPHDAFAALVEGMRLLEHRRRANIQLRLLDAFRAAGVVVDLFGPYWERHRASEGHRVHGPVTLGQLAGLMRETALYVATGGPSDGSLAEPLTAMAAGAAVVLEDTRWWSQHFGESAAIFSAGFPSEAVDAVITLREQRAMREELAAAGERAVLAGHLWWHRADAWLELLEARPIG